VKYARSKGKKKEGEEAEKKPKLNTKFQKKKKEIIQKETDYFHMLDSIARVLTNYHHTNKRTISD